MRSNPQLQQVDHLNLMKSKSSPDADLNALFDVRRTDKGFRRIVPKRIPFIRPFKDVTIFDAEWMKERAYEHAGLDEYMKCWTGEMKERPIPFVSRDPRPLRTQEVFKKYFPAVLAFLAPHIKPGIQTINKVSSLGYPVNFNPGDGVDNDKGSRLYGTKVKQSKFDVTLDLFALMQQGDFSMYRDGYHTIGCRKQNEPPSKHREFQFITCEGQIVQRDITAESRAIEVPEIGTMIGSRSRTIVRPPVVNLWLQCWDTLLHNAIKAHPLFDSNVYNKIKWPDDAEFTTFDCKHYERYLGLCAISYAEAIGGRYAEQLLQLIYYPFIVPCDQWRSFWELKPQFGPGVYPQFSSGLSPVAPLGKLANICVQVHYFVSAKKLPLRDAIAVVFSGVYNNTRRWSFGDDNRVMGPHAEVKDFCDFMGTYFDIEIDPVPQYLGTIYRPDLRRWVLPRTTYNLKLYQPERDFEFKDYPNLGLVERRATFTEFGEPEIASDLIPFENTLWDEVGYPFVKIVSASIAERVASQRKGIKLSSYLVTDKDYLMTEDEKIASGMFWHLSAECVATIVLSLVGDEVREMLQFRSMTPVPIPTPEARFVPFTQAGLPTKEESEEEEESEFSHG
jgi:hypothetical protein